MSNIEWTDETCNPITGCKKVSPGCANGYAESIAKRFWGERKFTDVQFHPDRLKQPLKWRKPRMVFVNSMSDLFHDSVTDEQLDQMFAVMALTPQHTYQVLTKRPDRMLDYFDTDVETLRTRWVNASISMEAWEGIGQMSAWTEIVNAGWPLPNVWLGCTVENQATADHRIPLLLQTPSAVRFLSCEPLLEEIDISEFLNNFTELRFRPYRRFAGAPVGLRILGNRRR